MTTYKPIFFRPIEITSSSNTVTYQKDGGAATDKSIDVGVYSSIPALLQALANSGQTYDATVNWALVQSGDFVYCRCTCSSGIKVTFTDAALGAIIGDPGGTMDDAPYATTRTAPYPPSHTWIPTHQNATQDYWHTLPKDRGAGAIAQTGELVGNAVGPELKYRKLKFTNEPALNIFDEAATDAYYKERNLEALLDCMYCSPTSSSNPSTRGFFFYPDWNEAIDHPLNVPGTSSGTGTTYLGTNYDYSSAPDRFTFCQFDINPFEVPGASHERGKLYYTFEFEIHTVDSMPTWESTTVD